MNTNNLSLGRRNLALLMDLYQLTMSQGYFLSGMYKDTKVVFDMFYRSVPDKGGFVISAGLEQFVEYLTTLHFDYDDIEILRSKNMFHPDFLKYLSEFKFKGEVFAIPEGTIVYPNEPIATIVADPIESQLIETMLLLTINHQSLIATKANRIVRAAGGRPVYDFGARRAQGSDGAIFGARAACIGGVNGTATVICEEMGINSIGTMAHSWIQIFQDEYLAFKNYAELYPDNCVLLVDTYDTLKQGVPNAIRVAKEVLEPMGKRLKGIRLDSGDLAYLSKQARKMLNEAGLHDCKITASNSLDEFTISTLIEEQKAELDSFGVGERLITSKSSPVFGGVYKVMAVQQDNGEYEPRIKISENIEKVTNPGYKSLWRLYDNHTGKAIADVLTTYDEEIDDTKPYVLFDPVHTWKKQTIYNFTAKKLHKQIIKNGEVVYDFPTLDEIKTHVGNELDCLWEEHKRLTNPQVYYVDLSQKLWELRNQMLEKHHSVD